LESVVADNTPDVAAVIVNYRTPELALQCVAALADERVRVPGLRAVVVDGGSGDESAQALRTGLDDPRFVAWTELLALPINGGFGWANNQAILRLFQDNEAPTFIYLLNPDAKIEPGALLLLLAELQAFPKAAACGSRLLDDEGRALGSAFRFPTPLREFARGLRTPKITRRFGFKDTMIDTDAAIEVDWVTGASVLFRSAALRQSGLFDDGFFLYFEEVELMWRLRRAGWSIRHAPASRVLHIGGASTGVGGGAEQRRRRLPDFWHQSRRRFFVLCYGRVCTVFAGAMWLVGHALWLLRVMVGRRADAVANEGCDHLRLGLIPRARDQRRSAPPWNASPGVEAAWMRARR
jgi:N-acetylglucosaminyl-diphospho-decaprenol L-rhamnosyltransferase